MSPPVVVLGAGPAGLAAACHLARSGVRPVVVEREGYVGGLCHTLEHQGFRFDIGGHRWLTKNEAVDRWVKDLMGDEFLRVDRVSRIYFRGAYFPYPLTLSGVVRSLGPVAAAGAFVSYLAAQVRRRAEADTMEDAFVRQFGRRLYEMFFRTYSEKVWGRPCATLSADWVGQRTKGLSAWGALRNALSPRRSRVVSLAEEFWYPRTGYGRIPERMAEEVARLGGSILLDTRVAGIVARDGRVRAVRVVDEAGTVRLVEAASIVSTIPLPTLVRMLEPEAPVAVRTAAGRLQFRNVITVTVLLDRPRVSPDTWLYVHDPEVPFARLHEPANWSPAMSPPGRTSLVAEYFVDRDDARWRATDEELKHLTVEHLAGTLGLVARNEVVGGHVFRAPNAYPVYTRDYRESLDAIKAFVGGFANLQIVGRGGTFRYNNSDHSIEMGILAARNLLGESHDVDQVNGADEYLEERAAG